MKKLRKKTLMWCPFEMSSDISQGLFQSFILLFHVDVHLELLKKI